MESTFIIVNGRYRGCQGVVTAINPSTIARPTVRLLLDAREQRIEPFEIDLGQDQEIEISTLLK